MQTGEIGKMITTGVKILIKSLFPCDNRSILDIDYTLSKIELVISGLFRYHNENC